MRAKDDTVSGTGPDGGVKIVASVLYVADVVWFLILGATLQERLTYGTGETGWGLLIALILVMPLTFPVAVGLFAGGLIGRRERGRRLTWYIRGSLIGFLLVLAGIAAFLTF